MSMSWPNSCRTWSSHPSRVRGLKYEKLDAALGSHGQSHPSRVRGLKFQLFGTFLLPLVVAPFTGAWIEILE